ncbi:MAG: hypothetical protein HW416_2331, partial [Chloroflexi bacterium]|nr:hypothetical protein [Chloroflexota bacterium]
WPFLLYKHGVRPVDEIHAALKPLPEGKSYR